MCSPMVNIIENNRAMLFGGMCEQGAFGLSAGVKEMYQIGVWQVSFSLFGITGRWIQFSPALSKLHISKREEEYIFCIRCIYNKIKGIHIFHTLTKSTEQENNHTHRDRQTGLNLRINIIWV